MTSRKYVVKMSKEERASLEERISKGQIPIRKLKRAQIILKADEGWSDDQIVEALRVNHRTVIWARRLFVEQGLEPVLHQSSRAGRHGKLDEQAVTKLVELIGSKVPQGYRRWTLRLLAAKLAEAGVVEKISYEGIRQQLKKMGVDLK